VQQTSFEELENSIIQAITYIRSLLEIFYTKGINHIMLKEDEIKYIETEIIKTFISIEKTFYYELLEYERDQQQEEYPGYTKEWIKYRVKDLYYLIKAYMESKGVSIYLQDFHQKFDAFINDDTSYVLKTQIYHPDEVEELKIIIDFKRFLNPFKAFDYRHTKEEESLKLISILKHTDYILKNIKAKILAEADIYKQVKWVLGLYYPKCRLLNKASFIQEFKIYNPDILIPELKTAIEYKYVRDTTDNIDEYIDQIRTDATNYAGDHRYENFIAVLYVKNTVIATHDAIQVSWEQKKFPKNWELVIAMGSK
jgi:hypothetical protein